VSERQTTTSQANGIERAHDWATIQEPTCRRVYVAVLAKLNVGPGMQYLDAGCGAGMAAGVALQLGAKVSGMDASEALLTIARQRVPSADLRQGELEQLPFTDGTFDVVTGFNSFQYAARPVAALKEAGRVAKPKATIVIMTWGEPAGMPAAQLVEALKPLLPPAPPNAPGPFALSSETALKAFASEAGLKPLEVLDVDCPWEYPDLATALRGLDSSGVAAKARAHSGEAAVNQAHEQTLSNFRLADGSYKVGASFRCLFTTP
jgi:SAM-dependent methyltransferase